MDVKNVEGLPNVLDNNTDEWHATLKVGIVGATALSERGEKLVWAKGQTGRCVLEACKVISDAGLMFSNVIAFVQC